MFLMWTIPTPLCPLVASPQPTGTKVRRGKALTKSFPTTHSKRSMQARRHIIAQCALITGDRFKALQLTLFHRIIGPLYAPPNAPVVMGTYLETNIHKSLDFREFLTILCLFVKKIWDNVCEWVEAWITPVTNNSNCPCAGGLGLTMYHLLQYFSRQTHENTNRNTHTLLEMGWHTDTVTNTHLMNREKIRTINSDSHFDANAYLYIDILYIEGCHANKQFKRFN